LASYGKIHFAELPSGLGGLLAEDLYAVDSSVVSLDEFLSLYEHAAAWKQGVFIF